MPRGLNYAARPPVGAAGVAGGAPRTRGRTLGRVVDVPVATVGVSDRGCAAAGGAVLVFSIIYWLQVGSDGAG